MFKTFRAAAIIAAAAATGLAALPAHAQDVIRVGNLKLAHFAGVSYIKEIEKECGIKAEAGDAIGLWSMCAFGPRENACALVVAGLGGHVRVGFENNLLTPEGALAANNAVQVRRVAEGAALIGRPLADAEAARAMMARVS